MAQIRIKKDPSGRSRPGGGFWGDSDVGDIDMLVTLWWWLISDVFSMYYIGHQHPESVTNISNLSPTHLVINIRHRHKCNPTSYMWHFLQIFKIKSLRLLKATKSLYQWNFKSSRRRLHGNMSTESISKLLFWSIICAGARGRQNIAALNIVW